MLALAVCARSAFPFATIDVPKEEDKGNEPHGSKVAGGKPQTSVRRLALWFGFRRALSR